MIDAHTSTIIVGLVNFFSTFLATIFIDKLGRKVLLFISSGTMTLMLVVFGAYFYFKSNGYPVSEYGWIPLMSFVTFVLGFSAGFGPIPWLMMGEILPGKYTHTYNTISSRVLTLLRFLKLLKTS